MLCIYSVEYTEKQREGVATVIYTQCDWCAAPMYLDKCIQNVNSSVVEPPALLHT